MPQSYGEALSAVRERALPSVVQLYRRAPDRVFLSAEPVARGAVLTSDGWMVVFGVSVQDVKGLIPVIGQQTSAIEQSVVDPTTGAIFIRVKENGLSVMSFGSGWDTTIGQQVFVLSGREEIRFTEVSAISHGDNGALSSDIPSRRFSLADSVDRQFIGSPVVDTAGELVGFVEANGYSVIPLQALLGAFDGFLKDGKVSRPSLGLNVVSLSDHVGLTEELTRGFSSGALVYGKRGVTAGSAAAKAGLKNSDIILSVDGQSVNATRSLYEYISRKRPEEEVTLSIDRAGERLEVKVILGILL